MNNFQRTYPSRNFFAQNSLIFAQVTLRVKIKNGKNENSKFETLGGAGPPLKIGCLRIFFGNEMKLIVTGFKSLLGIFLILIGTLMRKCIV